MSTHHKIITLFFLFKLSNSQFSNSQFADIANGERQAINSLLATFLPTTDYEKLLNHGCWCSHINEDSNEKGGKEKIDELDELCSKWFLIRRCTHWINGDCLEDDISHNHLDNSYTVLEIQGQYDCSINAGSDCANTTCVIDVHYLTEIAAKINQYNSENVDWPIETDECPKGEKTSENTQEYNHTCAGHAPFLHVSVKIFTPEDAVSASEAVNLPFETRSDWTGPTPVSNNLNYLNGARNYGFRSSQEIVSADFTVPNSGDNRKFAFGEDAIVVETPDGDGGTITSVDLRRHPYCGVLAGVIRNQGGCGSCWAFAAASSISDLQCFANNVLQELPSTQHFAACCDAEYGCTNGICLGGSFWKAHKYYKDYGVVTGNDYLATKNIVKFEH